jgi:predicted ferric reductase
MGGKEKPERRSRTTINLFLAIIVLVLIPIVLKQVDFSSENVRIAGRICALAALLLLLFGLVKNMVKIFALLLAALIIVMVLASEGIIDLPKLFGG